MPTLSSVPMQPFHPMVNLQCSPDLRPFLCALFAPVCTEYGRVSLPCRSLCAHARRDCLKLMEMFGVPWPEEMDCSRSAGSFSNASFQNITNGTF